MTTKAQLEAEIKSLNKSVGWYSGAYYRLRDDKAELEEQVADLSERIAGFEKELEKDSVGRERVQQRAEKARKARQAKMLAEELKRRAERAAQSPPEEDRAEVLLAKCQETNASLREQLAACKAKLKEAET